MVTIQLETHKRLLRTRKAYEAMKEQQKGHAELMALIRIDLDKLTAMHAGHIRDLNKMIVDTLVAHKKEKEWLYTQIDKWKQNFNVSQKQFDELKSLHDETVELLNKKSWFWRFMNKSIL